MLQEYLSPNQKIIDVCVNPPLCLWTRVCYHVIAFARVHFICVGKPAEEGVCARGWAWTVSVEMKTCLRLIGYQTGRRRGFLCEAVREIMEIQMEGCRDIEEMHSNSENNWRALRKLMVRTSFKVPHWKGVFNLKFWFNIICTNTCRHTIHVVIHISWSFETGCHKSQKAQWLAT